MRLLRNAVLLATLAAASTLAAVRLRPSSRGSAADVPAAVAQRAQAGGAGRQRRWLQIAALLAVLAAGGLLVAASGIVPIKASSGHWAITAWFLHFSMRRSVATHTLGLQAPALDAPRLVLKGAGHYETGCRPCHGSPDLPHPRIAQHMTPHPPYLPPRISAWEPDELFYIVKHGVKFTGMPAWPAQQRDDEVWAMVAFLRTLPDLRCRGRTGGSCTARPARPATTHRSRPAGTGAGAPGSHRKLRTLPRCGRPRSGCGRVSPKLAGQRPTYLYRRSPGLCTRGAPQRHHGADRRRSEPRRDARTRLLLRQPAGAMVRTGAHVPGIHAGHRARQGDRQPRHPAVNASLPASPVTAPAPPAGTRSIPSSPASTPTISSCSSSSSTRSSAAVRPMPTSCARWPPG